MTIDLLIIGQGICGSFLQWYARQAGLSVMVIDDPKPYSASKMAAGVINPVTGRRIVKTWMIDELLVHAREAYAQIGATCNASFLSQKSVIDFFPTPQMLMTYQSRYDEDQQFLQPISKNEDFANGFHYDFGYGTIDPCYLVDVSSLLSSTRSDLQKNKILLEEKFDIDELIIDSKKITYLDIIASNVIFCEGIEGFQNPWFNKLPFAPNKGEALIIEAAGIPSSHIFKKGINLVPWKEGLFWVGSSYQWEFETDQPAESFLRQITSTLQNWLKVPFKVVNHIAAVRPATIERRPFVGFHPAQPRLGILNGMGTKGCSLAPFFARQLVQHIVEGEPIQADANVQRFSRVLGRN